MDGALGIERTAPGEPLPLLRTRAPALETTTTGPSPDAVIAQRQVTSAPTGPDVGETIRPFVQRAVSIDEISTEAPQPERAMSGAMRSWPALFPRIRHLFRNEVIQEREAKGLSFDGI